MYSLNKYLDHLYSNNKPTYSFNARDIEEWECWRNDLKHAIIKRLGHFPSRKPALDTQVLEQKDFDTYTRQRISFTSDEHITVPAYVLIPKSIREKMPAVVACHGHGYGSREIVGINDKDEDSIENPSYQKNFALELVNRGFIVIVPELIGFGDMKLEGFEYEHLADSACHHISAYLLAFGKTMTGVRTWQAMRCIDYLETRNDVNIEKIGCMGISGGGLVCTFASALDERINAAVISGYTNTFKASVLSIKHCIDNYVPGLLLDAEEDDIISLIAPRPLLVESGLKDDIFPIEATLKAYENVKKVYDLTGNPEKIEKDIFDGVHEISGNKAYDWLEKWLMC